MIRELYQGSYLDGTPLPWPLGKAVCVGRNYLAHIEELGNAVPEEAVLFMKPATSYASLTESIHLPVGLGVCHYETEVAVLIGSPLKRVEESQVFPAVAGYGLALDLTLREVQDRLKEKGLPWERAKAFDGSCPLSPFVPAQQVVRPEEICFALAVNGENRQRADTRMMIRGIASLIAHISHFFTLLPGDVVLTGTPAGVGPLRSGDRLTLTFQSGLQAQEVRFDSRVD